MPPDEPSDEERQEQLPEDYDTPFRPATDGRDDAAEPDSERQYEENRVPDTHPETDTNIQPEELYDEGIAGAAEISEPNAGNAVVGYTPPAKQDDTAGAGKPASDDDEDDDDGDIAIQPS